MRQPGCLLPSLTRCGQWLRLSPTATPICRCSQLLLLAPALPPSLQAALDRGGPLAQAAALARLCKVLLTCFESGGRRVQSSNDFVNRSMGSDGEPLERHGYHRDSVRGILRLPFAARAIQNVPLDSKAQAALAFATGLGWDAVEAAVGYGGGSKMLVVDAPLLCDPPLYHANLSTAKTERQWCRTLSTPSNLLPPDDKCAVRCANIRSPQVRGWVEVGRSARTGLCQKAVGGGAHWETGGGLHACAQACVVKCDQSFCYTQLPIPQLTGWPAGCCGGSAPADGAP